MIPIIHVWQPDEGFQAGKIRNISIATAHNEYIIIIDGDVFLERHFIEDHIYHKRKNTFLAAKRFLLNAATTQQFIKAKHLKIALFDLFSFENIINNFRCRFLANFLLHIIGEFSKSRIFA